MTGKIRRFKDRLKEDLKESEFRRHYETYELPARLAVQIARLRRSKQLTQLELAQRIGVSQQFVARLENSEHTIPSLRTLERVAQALDMRLFVDFRPSAP